MVVLGEKLRNLRKARRLQQRKVAAKADMDASILSKIENGKLCPSRKQAASLAKVFDLDPAKLVTECLKEELRRNYASTPEGRLAITSIAEESAAYGKKKGNR